MASTMNRFYFLTLTAPIALTVACSVQEGHQAEMDAGAVGPSVGGSGKSQGLRPLAEAQSLVAVAQLQVARQRVTVLWP